MTQKYQVNDELPDGRIVTEVRPLRWGSEIYDYLYCWGEGYDDNIKQTTLEEMYHETKS